MLGQYELPYPFPPAAELPFPFPEEIVPEAEVPCPATTDPACPAIRQPFRGCARFRLPGSR